MFTGWRFVGDQESSIHPTIVDKTSYCTVFRKMVAVLASQRSRPCFILASNGSAPVQINARIAHRVIVPAARKQTATHPCFRWSYSYSIWSWCQAQVGARMVAFTWPAVMGPTMSMQLVHERTWHVTYCAYLKRLSHKRGWKRRIRERLNSHQCCSDGPLLSHWHPRPEMLLETAANSTSTRDKRPADIKPVNLKISFS